MKIRLLISIAVLLGILTACGGAKVDLQVLGVEKGNDKITVKVKNNGTAASGKFKMNVKLFNGEQVAADINKTVSGVAAGAEESLETSLSQTAYDKGEVTLDVEQKVSESDEENNKFSF